MKLFFTRTEFMSGRLENMAMIDAKILEEYRDEIKAANVVYDLIVDAITEWVEKTESGLQEWINSSNDFNVGDLSNINLDELRPFLNSRGIESIEVETATKDQMNYYDQILCEADHCDEILSKAN
jgi:hypothetical protein